MNDFTKEELQMILEDVEHMELDHMPSGTPHELLLIKIQSMIDNYCDNPWIDRNDKWPVNIEKVEFKSEDNITIGTAVRDENGCHINHATYQLDDPSFNANNITHWRRIKSEELKVIE